MHALTDPPVPAAAAPVVDAYRTAEFATLSRSGVPIAWPLYTMLQPDGTFLITTSIGLAQKALNIRRDPRIALLFSDPTASGLAETAEVLVQGTATAPDEVVTSPLGHETFWQRTYEREPGAKAYTADPAYHELMDWYFMRLIIRVVPRRWTVRPVVAANEPPNDGPLAGFASVVVGAVNDEGTPFLRRAGFRPDGNGFLLNLPENAEFRPGTVSLLAHSHSEVLTDLRRVVMIGELRHAASHWHFAPRRVIPAPSNEPKEMMAAMAGFRRSAAGYLERRGMAVPVIPWDEYRRFV